MADYEGVLSDLKARRAALDQERETLETAITALERLPPVTGDDENHTPVARRAFGRMNLPEALTKYATIVQSSATTSQIADALRAGGMRAKAKSFNNQVYNILRRLSDAGGPWQRESNGRWSQRQPKQAEGPRAA